MHRRPKLRLVTLRAAGPRLQLTGFCLNTPRLAALGLLVCLLVAFAPPDVALAQPIGDAWWEPQTAVDPGPTAADPATTARAPISIYGIGDSVMLGASGSLQRAMPGIEINAVVGRQASTGIDILRTRAAAGLVPDVVIVGLGTNGPLSIGQVDDAMSALTGVRRVVLVNNTMPRTWEAPNNALLADAVERYPNVVLADWHALTQAEPWLLTGDGIHLGPSGADAYAALVAPLATAPLAVAG